MTKQERRDKAQAAVACADIKNEQGLAVEQGYRSALSCNLLEFIDLFVPGGEVLFGGLRQTVLVTDKAIHLFRGREPEPAALIARFPLTPNALQVDRRRVILPGGRQVHMSGLGPKLLAQAGGVDMEKSMAQQLIDHLGIAGEQGVLLKRATSSETDRGATIRDWALDLAVAGGPPQGKTHQARLLLVTDRHIRIFAGDKLEAPGQACGVYEIGPAAFRVNESVITFPDGEVVILKTPQDARQVADAVGAESVEAS